MNFWPYVLCSSCRRWRYRNESLCHRNSREVFNIPWAVCSLDLWSCRARLKLFWSRLVFIHFSLSGYCTFEATSSVNPACDWQLLPAWPRSFDWQKNNGEAGGVCGWMLSWKSVRGDRETERGEGTRENREKRLDGSGKSTLSSFFMF